MHTWQWDILLYFFSLSFNSVHWNWRPNADLIKSKWKLKKKKITKIAVQCRSCALRESYKRRKKSSPRNKQNYDEQIYFRANQARVCWQELTVESKLPSRFRIESTRYFYAFGNLFIVCTMAVSAELQRFTITNNSAVNFTISYFQLQTKRHEY